MQYGCWVTGSVEREEVRGDGGAVRRRAIVAAHGRASAGEVRAPPPRRALLARPPQQERQPRGHARLPTLASLKDKRSPLHFNVKLEYTSGSF